LEREGQTSQQGNSRKSFHGLEQRRGPGVILRVHASILPPAMPRVNLAFPVVRGVGLGHGQFINDLGTPFARI
jgi:hypothetical protein